MVRREVVLLLRVVQVLCLMALVPTMVPVEILSFWVVHEAVPQVLQFKVSSVLALQLSVQQKQQTS